MRCPVKSILMLQKGSNMAQNDLEKVLCMISDVPRHIFFQNFGVESSKFLLSGKNGAPKSDSRVQKTFQNPNYLTKNAQIQLKMIPRIYSP